MYTLFIDTHSSLITIALVNDKECFVKEKESLMSHGKNLIPMIKELLDENKTYINSINNIIVINGPGSFTGIRVGLTVAKIISYALKISIKPISSLYSYLISSDIKDNKVCIIKDPKGYYVSAMDKDNKIILKEKYITDLEEIKEYKIVDNKLNIKKIYKQKDLKEVNVHSLKANYVKRIEALDND